MLKFNQSRVSVMVVILTGPASRDADPQMLADESAVNRISCRGRQSLQQAIGDGFVQLGADEVVFIHDS